MVIFHCKHGDNNKCEVCIKVKMTKKHFPKLESKNRTLVDMVNVMLLNANLPNKLWGEALLTACHIHNRVLYKKLNVISMKHGTIENQI